MCFSLFVARVLVQDAPLTRLRDRMVLRCGGCWGRESKGKGSNTPDFHLLSLLLPSCSFSERSPPPRLFRVCRCPIRLVGLLDTD